MKKKFLILTLCFTLVFTSINYKRSYADGGVISVPLLATVVSLGVGTGLVINNNEEIYNIGRKFYDYIDKHNELTWGAVTSAFALGHTVINNKIQVNSNFLDIVKGFFDNVFGQESVPIGYYYDIPVYSKHNVSKGESLTIDYSVFNVGHSVTLTPELYFKIDSKTDTSTKVGFFSAITRYRDIDGGIMSVFLYKNPQYENRLELKPIGVNTILGQFSASSSILTIPGGVYNWDNVESKKENDSISLPIPGNLGALVGQTSDKFWDNTENLVGTGGITIPNVDNPSVDIEDGVFSPSVPGVDSPSVPGENVWSNVTDYIISLVVPSDSFWTDSFSSLHSNFISAFPGIDMSGFNSLLVNGRPFPNIDIKIMGAKGRVVNGDTVNSIVDWLRPIIAGFVFLCLMFFNYRKIYKLIRNSEPFEGIGKVENHAN